MTIFAKLESSKYKSRNRPISNGSSNQTRNFGHSLSCMVPNAYTFTINQSNLLGLLYILFELRDSVTALSFSLWVWDVVFLLSSDLDLNLVWAGYIEYDDNDIYSWLLLLYNLVHLRFSKVCTRSSEKSWILKYNFWIPSMRKCFFYSQTRRKCI